MRENSRRSATRSIGADASTPLDAEGRTECERCAGRFVAEVAIRIGRNPFAQSRGPFGPAVAAGALASACGSWRAHRARMAQTHKFLAANDKTDLTPDG